VLKHYDCERDRPRLLHFFHSPWYVFGSNNRKAFYAKDKDPKRAEPRKGSEDKSVAHDMDKNREAKYPRPSQEDRQYDNQPEFNEHQANRKDEDQV